MFIRTKYSGYEGTEQVAAGDFLILCTPKDTPLDIDGYKEARALVRYVRLEQCGHWMMGRFRAFGQTLIVSGCYGADGLIMDVPREIWERAIPVPADLLEQWAHGGGHNSAGAEGKAMRTWARRTFPATVRMVRNNR